jgi:hypothetical protein
MSQVLLLDKIRLPKNITREELTQTLSLILGLEAAEIKIAKIVKTTKEDYLCSLAKIIATYNKKITKTEINLLTPDRFGTSKMKENAMYLASHRNFLFVSQEDLYRLIAYKIKNENITIPFSPEKGVSVLKKILFESDIYFQGDKQPNTKGGIQFNLYENERNMNSLIYAKGTESILELLHQNQMVREVVLQKAWSIAYSGKASGCIVIGKDLNEDMFHSFIESN